MSEIVMTSTQAPTKKKDAILAYRAANPKATANEMVKARGVNLQYVYSVLRGKKAKKAKGKIGRPRKVQSPWKAVAPLAVPPVKRDPELDNLRRSVSEHARIVDGLKKEIEELTVIIAYLEHRCFKAEGARGPSV